MRRRGAFVLVLMLNMMPVALLAAAQDTPAVGEHKSIYLPVVTAPRGTGNEATEVIEDHQIVLGEEILRDDAPKPVSTQPDWIPPVEQPAPESADGENVAPAATDVWVTLLNEGFESEFWPADRPAWRTFDGNAIGGELYWHDTGYAKYQGSASAWPAGMGANRRNPATQNYADNMQSWMIYGPVNLTDGSAASLSFYYWNNSELNWDHFGWYASADGTTFCGQRTSGYSGGWRFMSLNLATVPGCGSMLDNGSVWIAFVFTSDSSITYKGPFVDNVYLASYKPQPVATYYNGSAFNTQVLERVENWPIRYNWYASSPFPGTIPADNFSVKWKGYATFTAGTYTFYAKADDGVRIYVDNVLVVDGWYDHYAIPFYGTHTLTGGLHWVEVWYYENRGSTASVDVWWMRKAEAAP